MRLIRTSTLVVLALAAATGLSSSQGTYNGSAFEKVMDGTMKSLRVVMGSLIAGDWGKAQGSAEAMASDAKIIRSLTPKNSTSRIGEFQAYADSLAAQSARVAAAAKAHKQDLAAQGLGQMVQTCMGCHSVFRK